MKISEANELTISPDHLCISVDLNFLSVWVLWREFFFVSREIHDKNKSNMKKIICFLMMWGMNCGAWGYAGRSQFLMLPPKDFRFQTSLVNQNYKATVTTTAGQSESSITGFTQNFGAIYSFIEGHQIGLSTSYVNMDAKVSSRETNSDVRTKISGLGNLDLGYQGAREFEFLDLFYGVSYSFKHQGKHIRQTGQNAFEANAVQSQNGLTPSVGVAVPTLINVTVGGEFVYTIKEDGEVRQDLADGSSVTTRDRQGNVTAMKIFAEIDVEYLPFLSLKRTHFDEQVSEVPASGLRFSNDPYDADTWTVGATIPISDVMKVEPRLSQTKYTYSNKGGFSVSNAEQTSLNVNLTMMF